MKQLNGGPEKWGLDASPFDWHLIIKPEASGRVGLHPESNKPRFEARYKVAHNKYTYINPFTGHKGEKELRHEPLETPYF